MRIEKSFQIKAPREHVWTMLNDVRLVAECLPGAAIIGELGDNRYKGRMSVKVGPMAAAFNGEIGIDSRKQDWTGVVSGKGADSGSSSRASGAMTYTLAEGSTPASTRVDIVSEVNLAGPLAQFSKGQIVQEIANRITAAFVANFEARIALPAGQVDRPALTASAPPASPPHQPASQLDAGGLLWAVLRERVRAFFRRLLGRPPAGA